MRRHRPEDPLFGVSYYKMLILRPFFAEAASEKRYLSSPVGSTPINSENAPKSILMHSEVLQTEECTNYQQGVRRYALHLTVLKPMYEYPIHPPVILRTIAR